MTAPVEAVIGPQTVVRAMQHDGEFCADILIMLGSHLSHVEWGRVLFEIETRGEPSPDEREDPDFPKLPSAREALYALGKRLVEVAERGSDQELPDHW